MPLAHIDNSINWLSRRKTEGWCFRPFNTIWARFIRGSVFYWQCIDDCVIVAHLREIFVLLWLSYDLTWLQSYLTLIDFYQLEELCNFIPFLYPKTYFLTYFFRSARSSEKREYKKNCTMSRTIILKKISNLESTNGAIQQFAANGAEFAALPR